VVVRYWSERTVTRAKKDAHRGCGGVGVHEVFVSVSIEIDNGDRFRIIPRGVPDSVSDRVVAQQRLPIDAAARDA